MWRRESLKIAGNRKTEVIISKTLKDTTLYFKDLDSTLAKEARFWVIFD